MIYARQNRYGILWKFRNGSVDELIRVEKAARSKYGSHTLTGKIFGQAPTVQGVKMDRSIPPGFWLFELRSESHEAQPDRV